MFWSIIYAYITVNFYWSELDTSSGQIYCTLDILDIVHSYNREVLSGLVVSKFGI